MRKAAIIGCGNIAHVHARALEHLTKVRLVACVDPILQRASELSDQSTKGLARIYDSLSAMLAQETPDVVHICTPHYLHVPMALELLSRNIHIFVEKPPAISLAEFRQLEEVQSNSAGRIGFCFQNRYNQSTKALDKIVQNRELGELLGGRAFVTWRRDEAYYSDEWHGRLSLEGGGVLINQAIHTLDLLLRYLGTPAKLDATMSNHHLQGSIEVEDTLEAWMEFPGGKRACFYATTGYATDAPVLLELTFEKGLVTLTDQTLLLVSQENGPRMLPLPAEPGIGKPYWGNGHLSCIRDFYQHLDEHTPYCNDLAGVRNTIETTLRIYDSARANK